ncbi:conserved membrane hypothetical protein [Paraburkholderia tropica]|uniref:hypothetical protein n=1 Tax=Paraburkholderia tropica TaxID=92647 RepID=UPI001CB21E40|nr:hypothetical protein [Paraburkholderia tropica]CAG9199535.1 conserved membrane hypothetical protein [Paraburkholderia tropica]
MQQMTFMECVKCAWASAREAVTQMPGLVIGTFLIYAALGWVAMAGRPVPGDGDDPSSALILAANIATILNALVYLWFTLKIYRFVLLGEQASPVLPGGAMPLVRLLGFGVVLVLGGALTMALFWLVLRPHHTGGILFLSLVVVTLWMCVAVRLCLLSPALAMGGRFAFGAAWRDSRGHFWSLAGVSFMAALPVLLCGLVVMIGLVFAGITPESVETPAGLAALALGQSAANIAFVLVTTTALAWLHRRYAKELDPQQSPRNF